MADKMTMAEFQNAIQSGLCLVDFMASWCGPCKMLAPIVEQIKTEMADTVKVIKLDVDEAQDIASMYGVRTIPALFIIKNGEVVDQLSGIQDKSKIVNALKNA